MRIALTGYEANVANRVGSNLYAFEIMKALYELDQKNHYTVFLPTPPLADLPKARTNWQYQVNGPSKLWNLTGLPWALKRQQPSPEVVFSPGHYAPWWLPAPLVVSIMDLGFLQYPQHFNRATYLKLKFWTGFSLKKAARVIAISQATKKDLLKNYSLKADQISVTHLGYDQKRFHPGIKKENIDQVKKKYQLKGDYLLFLSTLKPSKNVEGLLAAYQQIASKSNLDLVIAGRKGWLYQSIFTQVKKQGLAKKVIFTDFVSEVDKPALMAGAKVFVLPSFFEGFGIPVLEAMACGTPVVVSGAGSLPEIVGPAGIIVDPSSPSSIAQGINLALKKEKELSSKGLAQAKKFSWEKCGRQTIEILTKIGENKKQ